ncbi:MAG: hypothetical protein KJZ93_26355 [Caldilineaceae bacterium]|nr:hypothetical protein [Caldilineaceae bacterium]
MGGTTLFDLTEFTSEWAHEAPPDHLAVGMKLRIAHDFGYSDVVITERVITERLDGYLAPTGNPPGPGRLDAFYLEEKEEYLRWILAWSPRAEEGFVPGYRAVSWRQAGVSRETVEEASDE